MAKREFIHRLEAKDLLVLHQKMKQSKEDGLL